jgi:hypothetical protein
MKKSAMISVTAADSKYSRGSVCVLRGDLLAVSFVGALASSTGAEVEILRSALADDFAGFRLIRSFDM